jgi:hypothetical protein
LIIKLADEDDDRLVWITVRCGGNTLAQAIWRVPQSRSPEELKAFLNKLRVYDFIRDTAEWLFQNCAERRVASLKKYS